MWSAQETGIRMMILWALHLGKCQTNERSYFSGRPMQDLESSKSYGGAEKYQTQSKHCQGHNGPKTLSVQTL